jgi:hypothetical protein
MKRFSFIFILVICICSSYAQKSDFKHISLKKADSIAFNYKDESLHNLPILSYKLTHNLSTDVEKFRAIYKWVCIAIANDYSLWDLNQSKRNRFENKSEKLKIWNIKIKEKLYNRLLNDKRTICSGYAFLIKELCDLANLETKVIHGFGKTAYTTLNETSSPNHSWNSVLLNNKWYLVDATWASGSQNPTTYNFEFNYSDGYFLTHPKLFATNHYPIDSKWQLIAPETFTFDSFLKAPIFYRDGFEILEQTNYPTKFHTNINLEQKASFSYLFSKELKTEELQFLLDDGKSSKLINPELVETNGHIKMNYKFLKTGFYDVHLMYKTTFLATYTYNVVP